MTDPGSVRSLNCPNCGAPLELQVGQPITTCRFCGSTIERSADALSPDDRVHTVQVNASGTSPAGQPHRFIIKMRDGQPVVIELSEPPPARDPALAAIDQMIQASRRSVTAGTLSRAPTRPAARRSPVAAVIAVVAVIALVGVIIFAAASAAGPLGTRILVGRSGVLVPGADGSPAEALLLTTQYPPGAENPVYRLLAVNTATRALLWQSAPLEDNTYAAPILFDADRAYTVSGQQLLAFHRSDGSTAWQATLADKVSLNLCLNCVLLLGARLAALSNDGTLQVLDAATGQVLWKMTAWEASPRGLYVLGGRLAFMDRDADVKGVLRTFEPATGKETAVVPVCQSVDSGPDYADWTTRLFVPPDGSDFYLTVGFGRQCLQRWDAQGLRPLWSAEVPDEFSPSFAEVPPAFGAEAAYVADGHTLASFARNDGAARTLLADADYDLRVLAAHGGDIILQARRQRGTTRYEIWAVNAKTGERRWQFDLGENPPLDNGGIIDDNAPMWLAQPQDAGLRLVRFQSAADDKSHALLVERLDWASGRSGGQQSTRLGLSTIILSAPDWTAWNGDVLWMVIENQLTAFDAAQGKIVYRWP